MTANEWLKAELKKEYGDKAEAVYSAIINCRPIQFSSPQTQVKFEAILKEWDRQGEAEIPEQDHGTGQYPASNLAPRKLSDNPLAEYRKASDSKSAGMSEDYEADRLYQNKE